MRSLRLTRLSLLAWVALLACGPRPGAERPSDLQPASLGEPASAALVVGCWELAWGLSGGPAQLPVSPPPDSIRLREEVLFGSRERLVAPATHPSGRSADGSGEVPWEARFVLNRWRMVDDELRIRFSDGEGKEWEVSLGTDGEGLVGTARYSADPDAPGGPQRAEVTGRRITCDFE